MMVPQPRLSFGALALVVSLALPVGFLSLIAHSTTGEQVDAADLIVVGRVASLQFVEDPPRTIVELEVERVVVGQLASPTFNVVVDGRSSLAAGDSIVGLLGQDPTELLATYQVRKNQETLEYEVVSDVTGMLAQGVRGGGTTEPVPLGAFELGIRARRGLPAATFGAANVQGQGQGPMAVTGVPPDDNEPNDTISTRTDVTGLHPPTLVTGHPLILSGLTISKNDVDFFSMDALAYTLLFAETLPPEVTGLPIPDTYMGLFDAFPPSGELLTVDDDSGEGNFSKFVYLFQEDSPIAVGVESAPDPTNKFNGTTGTTEGFYQLSLEFKLGSFLANGLDTVIGVSKDGTFIEDLVGYKITGGDDALLDGVAADGWGLQYDVPGGITHVFGGSGEQLSDPGFLNAVRPISFELGPYVTAVGINRRGFAQASMMVEQSTSPSRGVNVSHTYRLELFDRALKGDLSLEIATDDAVNDMLFTRVMDVDLFDNGGDNFSWTFDPNGHVKAFPVDTSVNVGNVVAPVLHTGNLTHVDRQFALWVDAGDTPAGSFGDVSRFKIGFTLVHGFSSELLAQQEAVRRLRFETDAEAWVVAVDQDPVSGKWSAFGMGVND
jgi:hypothetical protein